MARPSALLSLFFRAFFDPRDLDRVAERLRNATEGATVVYVLSHVRLFDVLFLNAAFLARRLPLALYVAAVRLWFLQPLRSLWAWLHGGRKLDPVDRFERVLRSGRASLLFLRPPPGTLAGGGGPLGQEHLQRLLEIRGELGRPVVLVPVVVLWGLHPVRPSLRDSALGKIFGPPETPGRIRSFVQFFLYLRRLLVLVGRPISLSEFVEEHSGEPVRVQARRLRWALSRELERQRRVMLGPKRKGARRIRQEILASPRVREEIHRIADAEGMSEKEALARAEAYLKEISADIGPMAIRFLRLLLTIAFRRMYSRIEVSKEVVERLRAVTQEGPVLLLPSHKSHVDYLFVSWVMGTNGIAPPLIAAGINLSFWPIGPIFRHSGAFFLRRRFRGNRLYAFIFAEYLAKVLSEGYSIEFFIEGGRSRTGKVLPPKLGMLRWIAQAAVEDRVPEVQILPIDISYDRVVETRSYARELAGGSKRKEDVGDLFRAGRVLGSTYGRVAMYVGNPYGLKETLRAMGAGPEADPRAFDAAVVRLAHKIVYDISRLVRVSPSSLVAAGLLVPGTRHVPRTYVHAAARFVAQRVLASGGVLADQVLEAAEDEAAWERTMDAALDLMRREGVVSWHWGSRELYCRVEDEARPILAYYRNNLVNLVVAEALMARAYFSLDPRGERGWVPLRELRRATLQLSRLFKKEFVYRVGATFDVIFRETLSGMLGWAFLLAEDPDGDRVVAQPGGRRHLELLGALVADFAEAYWGLARGLKMLLSGPMPRRSLERRLHEHLRREHHRGILHRREACIRPMCRNALDLWSEEGVLKTLAGRARSGPVFALAEEYASEESLDRLAASMAPFVAEPVLQRTGSDSRAATPGGVVAPDFAGDSP